MSSLALEPQSLERTDTYRPSNRSMPSRVRYLPITIIRPIRIVVPIKLCFKARLRIRAIPLVPHRLREVAAQAVLRVIHHTILHPQPQRRIRKRTILHAVRAQDVAAPKALVGGPKHAGVGKRPGVGVALLIPVGLATGVVALGLQQLLVHTHEVAVPREELPGVVDDVGLEDVQVLELVPAVEGAGYVGCGGKGHETLLGANVLCLFGSGEGVPFWWKA